MPTETASEPARSARTIPLRHVLPSLLRDPVNALVEIGATSGGEIVRLNLGPFRPYLVTHPDHIQQILRSNSASYARDGVFWRPLRRFFGDSIVSDGQEWKRSRKVLQPIFTARHVDSLTERMAGMIADEVEAWSGKLDIGQPIDMAGPINRTVTRTIVQTFFGDKVTMAEAERLVTALDSIGTSVVFRFLLPFVPEWVPMPGDAAFRDAVRKFDEVFFPLAQKYRGNDGGEDIVSVLCRAQELDGRKPSHQWIRDNLVSMFASGIETTASALTWVWPILSANPDVAARLYAEIDEVVGGGRVTGAHLAELPYMKRVIQEMLRLHPVAWVFNRLVMTPQTVGGVALRRGDTVLLSPYATHRLETFWDRPYEFDPDRFTADRVRGRHRYAYFPFGGGPHMCIGMHLFEIEAQLIIGNILSRFRPVSCDPQIVTPRIGASLRPREQVQVMLRPAAECEKDGYEPVPR
ncbi:cytochrome P450 [Microbispora sp. NPDC088329]|uniref:cytochrome P450 n=1 Tax=Microbispora sp. NPDC088329 TaxID=3154869 RepID=UPI00342150FC